MTLEELAEKFRACTLPHGEWTHSAHLRVGAWHVHRFGPEAALDRLRTGIRRLNDSHGTPNSDTRGYHETVTVAYVRLIAEHLAAGGDVPFADEVDLLLASPLARPDLLLTFWSKELLMSPTARATWVEPDLAPLALPGL